MSDRPSDEELERVRRWDRERECAMHGHDFEVVVSASGAPRHVVCGRCGRSWKVVPSDAFSTVASASPGSTAPQPPEGPRAPEMAVVEVRPETEPDPQRPCAHDEYDAMRDAQFDPPERP